MPFVVPEYITEDTLQNTEVHFPLLRFLFAHVMPPFLVLAVEVAAAVYLCLVYLTVEVICFKQFL